MAVIDARELIRIAKRDEDVGARFYEALAGKVTDEELKKRMLEIRDQEIGHSKRFQEMLDGLGDYVPREELSGEYDRYYESFLSKREYMEGDEAVEKALAVESDIEAIKFAIGQEKSTLLFFIEMKELIPAGQHRELVQAVIDEERDHIVELSQLLMDRM